MIRAAVPEVRDIIDVTDHAAGKTPYYSDGLGDKRQLNSATAHEIPAPLAATKAATAGNVLRDRIRQHLSSLPAAEMPITCGKLARSMGLNPPGTITKVMQALEATMVEDAENGVPFLASLVVSKVGQGNAAKGFFQQASALGREPSFGEDYQAYYQREFNGAVAIVIAIAHAADSQQDQHALLKKKSKQ
jgi:hypothetical protein